MKCLLSDLYFWLRLMVPYAGSAMLVAAPANAASMADYFNGYGTRQANLHELLPSGGTGWDGDWTQPTGGTIASYSDFLPGEQVNPEIPGYSSFDNAAGPGDGAVGEAANTHNYNLYRGTSPLDGTIWISAAYCFEGFGNYANVTFFFDDITRDGTNSIRLWNNGTERNPGKTFTYDSAVSQLLLSPPEGANLMVAKIEMNIDGGDNDRISIWTDAVDLSSEAALGEADFVADDGDPFGSTFDHFGIFARSSRIDSIRISNEVTAFRYVATGYLLPPPDDGLRILSIARTDGGDSTVLTWRSEVGRLYAIETSTDLEHWVELDDSWPLGGATGEVTSFEHVDADSSPLTVRRYYRVAPRDL